MEQRFTSNFKATVFCNSIIYLILYVFMVQSCVWVMPYSSRHFTPVPLSSLEETGGVISGLKKAFHGAVALLFPSEAYAVSPKAKGRSVQKDNKNQPGDALNSPSSIAVLGPDNYFVREKGKPFVESVSFPASYLNHIFTLTIYNGGFNQEFYNVTSGVITLNDQEIAYPKDFKRKFDIIKKDIQPLANNRLDVKLRSKPGSGIFLLIELINNAPQALDDSYGLNEDETLTIEAPGILDNDSDLDNDQLSVLLVQGTSNGILELNPDGSFSYTPNQDFYGTDSFTYKATDGLEDSNIVTVSLIINPINDTVEAHEDVFNVDEDTTLCISAPGVLSNDLYGGGDSLIVNSFTIPENGTLTQNPNGSLTYIPNPNFYGTDTYTYEACASGGLCDNALVIVTVNPVNDLPLAEDDLFVIDEDTILTVPSPGILNNDLDVDGDALTVNVVTYPSNGALTQNTDGSLTYEPYINFNGVDNYTYNACDQHGACNEAIVTIDVTSVNDAPIANGDKVTTFEDQPITIDAIFNDTDIENNIDPTTASVVTGPENGTVNNSGNGTFLYTPNLNFNGTDSFEYKICDTEGACDTALIILTIIPVNDPPTITTATITGGTEGIQYTYDVDAIDPDGDALTFSLNIFPAGMSIDAAGGLINWTPTGTQAGDHIVEVQVDDGQGGTDTQNYTITVTEAINNAPVITSIPITNGTEGIQYNYDVEATDADNDVLIYILNSLPSGMTIDAATGSIDWTPNGLQSGDHPVAVQVDDGRGGIATQHYTITVAEAINNPPLITSSPITTGTEGLLYAYDVDATDPDNDVMTFSLNTSPLGMSIDAATGLIQWTPQSTDIGSHNIEVSVSDGCGGEATQAFTIDVEGINHPPVITSTPLTRAYNETIITLEFDVMPNAQGWGESDPETLAKYWSLDGTTLAINTMGEPLMVEVVGAGFGFFNVLNPDLPFSATLSARVLDEEYTILNHSSFCLWVNPGSNSGDPKHYKIVIGLSGLKISDGNTLTPFPVPSDPTEFHDYRMDANPEGDFDIFIDESFVVTHQAIDYIASNMVCFGDGSSHGNCHAEVRGFTFSQPAEVYRYQVEASDPDADPLTYILQTAPMGMTIDSTTGLITWPPASDQLGNHDVTVEVTDGRGGSIIQSFVIEVRAFNRAPEITSVPVTQGAEGSQYQYNVEATDIDGDPIYYILTVAPVGMVVGSSNGLIQWTPSYTDAGKHDVEVRACDGRAGWVKQSFSIQVSEVNDPPVITSTPITAGTEDVLYQYDVDATDPDGDLLTFVLTTSPAGMTIDASIGLIQWTPQQTHVGDNPVIVQVQEGRGGIDTQSFSIMVQNINDPPYITSTPLLTGTEGIQYAYDVDAIDPDGDVLTFSLNIFPAGMSIDAAGGLINWTPTGTQAGDHIVEVQVDDGQGGTDTQQYTLTVTEAINNAPVITSTPISNGTEGIQYNYDVEATDADNDVLTYSLNIAPLGMTIDAATGFIDWTPSGIQSGNHLVEVQVDDGRGGLDTQQYTLTVAEAMNNSPLITSSPITTGTEGILYTYDVNATDPDDDAMIFSLNIFPLGMAIDAATGLIQWTPQSGDIGSQNIEVSVSDGRGGEATQAFTIDVESINHPAVIISTPLTRAYSETKITLEFDVMPNAQGWGESDPETLAKYWSLDGTTLTMNTMGYPMSVGAGFGLFDVLNPDLPFTATIRTRVVAEESYLVDHAGFSLWANPGSASGDPKQYCFSMGLNGVGITDGITSTRFPIPSDPTEFHDYRMEANPEGDFGLFVDDIFVISNQALYCEGQNCVIFGDGSSHGNGHAEVRAFTFTQPAEIYRYDVEATDPDSDSLTYMLQTAPVGMTIDSATGLIIWPPASDQLGNHDVSVEVTDGRGGSIIQSFVIEVRAFNRAPEITSIPVTQGAEGGQYQYNVDATDIDGDPIYYILTVAPAGMVVGSSTGLIQWTPSYTDAGIHDVEVRACDGRAGWVKQSFTIQVSEVNDPPVITSTPITAGTEDVLYQYDVEATDPDGDLLTFALTTSPAGMTIDASIGLIQWTPQQTHVGDNPVIVQVQDGRGGIDAQSFNIVIQNANDSPQIISIPETTAHVSVPYSYDVDATDINGDTLLYSLDVAPSAMTINSNTGLIQWTPDASQVGDNTVRVMVSDPSGAFDTQKYTLTVQLLVDNTPPRITNIDIDPLILNPGETTTITIEAVDNVGIGSYDLTVDGFSIPLVGNTGTYTATTIGIHTAQATACDFAGNCDTLEAGFGVRDPSDTTPPTVSIITPATDSELTEPTDLIGTASDINLVHYTLEYSEKDKNNFIQFHKGHSEVLSDVLGALDTTLLVNGLYDIRLTAVDVNGLTASAYVTYRITEDLKVGNFTVTFKDLEVPVAGIPITIYRTYDSRIKHNKGDFGYGWNIDIRTTKVEENRASGEGWYQQPSGGWFPTYYLLPNGAHYVSITLPDGQIMEFDCKFSPESSSLIPIQWIDYAIYTPRPGTHGTLAALDDSPFYFDGSTVFNIDLEIYNPERYQLTTLDGTVFIIDQNTGLQKITDTNSNSLTITSGGIIHSTGKSVTFTRDGEGRITDITDPMGNVITYTYDGNGDLESMTDPEGYTSEYAYNSSHGLTDIIDPRGITPMRNEYDYDGRLIAHTDAEGNCIEYTHNIDTRQEIVSDRLGNINVFEYDDKGNVTKKTDALGNVTSYTYDSSGNMLSETDPLGNTTIYTYDVQDNMLTQTDPLGNTTSCSYNGRGQVLTTTDPLGNATSNTYDANGNLLTTTDPMGNVTSNGYDAGGNLISTTDALGNVNTYTYDSSGNMISQADPLGNVTIYTYDNNGNQLTQTVTRTTPTGPETITTTNVYDGLNRLVQAIDPYANITTTEYNAIGKQAATIDKIGNRTAYEYDSRGNLIKTTYPDGTTETAAYDAEGRKTSSIDRAGIETLSVYDALGRLIQSIYPDGASPVTTYDAAGRVVAQTDARGNTTTYAYDAPGRRICVTDPLGNATNYTYDANGNQLTMTDANGHTYTYTYDANNRRTHTTFPDGTTGTVTYDALGRKIAETDQAGITTQFEYDALGRLIRVIDALGQATGYTYDELGNKISQTDANGHSTTWEYDSLGRATKRILPLGMFETMAYDTIGNLISKTDFSGDTITYTYDNNNRLVQKLYPDSSSVSFAYTGTGQRASVLDSRGLSTFVYDERDKLIQRNDPDGTAISYTYDEAGNRISVTVPSGTTTYTFDALNRLSTVTDPDGGVTSYTYDAVGNRAGITYPNGTKATYTYDALNRLIILENKRSNDLLISSYQYTLGLAGNRIRVQEHTGRVVDYIYDLLYRLTEESITDAILGNRNIFYSYDPVGNRLTKTKDGVTTNYIYDVNDRLLAEGTIIYTYDANGNTLSKIDGADTTTYTYDYENSLITVYGLLTIAYSYDADGSRISKTINGSLTKYLLDKNRSYAQVLEERDNTGVLCVRYIYGDDLLSQKRGLDISYYHYDGLGSTRLLTNVSQIITDTYTYEAFGTLLGSTGTTENNYLFTGEQYDPYVGLYYLRARYYDPPIGRFVSADPFPGQSSRVATLNRYAYAGSNPVNNLDPSGQFWIALQGALLQKIVTQSYRKRTEQVKLWRKNVSLITKYLGEIEDDATRDFQIAFVVGGSLSQSVSKYPIFLALDSLKVRIKRQDDPKKYAEYSFIGFGIGAGISLGNNTGGPTGSATVPIPPNKFKNFWTPDPMHLGDFKGWGAVWSAGASAAGLGGGITFFDFFCGPYKTVTVNNADKPFSATASLPSVGISQTYGLWYTNFYNDSTFP